MNGSLAIAAELGRGVAAGAVDGVETILCPPFPYLGAVSQAIAGSGIALGAQNCSEHDAGAYTGEVAASMLIDCGCTHVIVGHSERRQLFGETDQQVADKLVRAQAGGLTPILCVGETLEQRQAGDTERVIEAQLDAVLTHAGGASGLGSIVVAYEPVWAIGTGETATPEQAQAVHAHIRARVAGIDGAIAEALRILYGGSVKPDNATALFACPDIDGGLIGGAALKAASFLDICRAAAA